MSKSLIIVSLCIILGSCRSGETGNNAQAWSIAVIPSSVRLDPSTNEIIENRFVAYKSAAGNEAASLKKNWVYDGKKAAISGARGEYVSFQVVLSNHTDSALKAIRIELPAFKKDSVQLDIKPELFLEWAVEVKTPSTGYQKASLGKGWYPDALIPLEYIQADSMAVHGRWVYPLWLPDFNNRINDQKSLVVWVDQFIPFEEGKAPAGVYKSLLSVSIGKNKQQIPVELNVWNFSLPNANAFKASLQQEGFLSAMDEKQELEYYQLFKRNRIALMDPTYKPVLQEHNGKEISLEWKSFDERLAKYFTGKAFTAEYGYTYGPGYGEPLETYILPFDVHGKHGEKGWPETGDPATEQEPAKRSRYVKAVQAVRDHLKQMVDPQKTDITVYLNGLDESYNQEAYSRMIYYGNLFREFYPEAYYRIDGAYDEKAMEQVHSSISSWASHTINYDPEKAARYQDAGVKVWLYGPMLYEGKVNSWVGSSSFTDLPMLNDRAISWASWKYNTRSWLSWGIGVNGKGGWYDPESWKDEYKAGSDSDPDYTYKILNGSSLMVYSPGIVPNVSVACPSIRLKAMRDGVQEYEYLRLLKQLDKSGKRADSIVNTIVKRPFGEQSMGNLDVWSYDAAQWDKSRILIGEMINGSVQQQ